MGLRGSPRPSLSTSHEGISRAGSWNIRSLHWKMLGDLILYVLESHDFETQTKRSKPVFKTGEKSRKGKIPPPDCTWQSVHSSPAQKA